MEANVKVLGAFFIEENSLYGTKYPIPAWFIVVLALGGIQFLYLESSLLAMGTALVFFIIYAEEELYKIKKAGHKSKHIISFMEQINLSCSQYCVKMTTEYESSNIHNILGKINVGYITVKPDNQTFQYLNRESVKTSKNSAQYVFIPCIITHDLSQKRILFIE